MSASRIRRKELGVSVRTATSSSRKIFSRLPERRSEATRVHLHGTLTVPIFRFRLPCPPDRERRLFARSCSFERPQMRRHGDNSSKSSDCTHITVDECNGDLSPIDDRSVL